MIEETSFTPKAGGRCPHCEYFPLFEDSGIIVCAGCDARWDMKGLDADWKEPEEE